MACCICTLHIVAIYLSSPPTGRPFERLLLFLCDLVSVPCLAWHEWTSSIVDCHACSMCVCQSQGRRHMQYPGVLNCAASHRLCMGLYFSSATATLPLDEPMARSSCMSDVSIAVCVGRYLGGCGCTGSLSRRCSLEVVCHREPLPWLLACRLRCTGSFSRRCSHPAVAPRASLVVARIAPCVTGGLLRGCSRSDRSPRRSKRLEIRG